MPIKSSQSLPDMKCQCLSNCCKSELNLKESSSPPPTLLCCFKIWFSKKFPRKKRSNT